MEAFDIFIKSYETGLPLTTLTVSQNMTIGKLKKLFAEHCKYLTYPIPNILHSDDEIFYPEKQLFWYNGVSLKRDYLLLKDYDIKPASILFVSDKGIQFSYRLVSLIYVYQLS